MIILSVGMPRAGSGWHYNLIHDLVKTAGGTEARFIRQRYHLQSILTEVNCNIGVLSAPRLAMVAVPALLGHTFVIKAHAAPTRWSRLLQKWGWLRITYIYRDPRDAMLSAYEYGRRALEKGRPNAFSHLTSFEETLDFICGYVRIWEQWQREQDVLIARYEDLLTHYDREATRLLDYLGLNGNRPELREVIERYRPQRAEGQQGTHFHKGQIGRFRHVYSPEQQKLLNEHFAGLLPQMGYPL